MISIDRRNLSAALSLVSRVAERKSTLPILSHVHLATGGDGRLRATCTDLTTFATVALACDGTAQVDAALDVRAVVDRLKRFKNGSVALYAPETPPADESGRVTTGDTRVALVEGTRRYELPWTVGGEFPPTPDASGASLLFLCEAATLAKCLDRAAFAVSEDETRPHLNSMLLEVSPGQIRMVATDGHRLSMHAEQAYTVGSETTGLLLSLSAVEHIRAMLGKKPSGSVRVERTAKGDGGTLHLTHGDATIATRLVDATFPPYEQVVPSPESMARRVTCDRAAMLEALAAVVVAASERTGGIKLRFEADRIVLSAKSPENGAAQEEVSAHAVGESEAKEIGFNAAYLRDALTACEARYVTLASSGELDPMRVDCDGTVGVVMPMRI